MKDMYDYIMETPDAIREVIENQNKIMKIVFDI